MLTRPDSPDDHELLAAVRSAWLPQVTRVEHLPVGFEAHHWKVEEFGRPRLFVTVDTPSPGRAASSYEAAYSAASKLATAGFAGIVAPSPTVRGGFTVPVAGGLLSATPWVDGHSPSEVEAATSGHVEGTPALLTRLQAMSPPPSLPVWKTRVAAGFAERTHAAIDSPWQTGPLGEQARELLTSAAGRFDRWEARHSVLAGHASATRHRWVVTHGEPHSANQLLTPTGLVLVDWETCALAPPERDTRNLSDSARAAFDVAPEMIELFALEWRLSEIQEYTAWFQRPHTGTEDDLSAYEDLRNELEHG